MKWNKSLAILNARIKSFLAEIWRKIKEHPLMTIATGMAVGGSVGGGFLLSGCEKPDTPPNTPPAIIQPSGDIESGLPSGLPGIGSGEEIDSGNEIESGEETDSGEIASGDIDSGEVPPSGDVEEEQFPTSVEELTEEQKIALYNAIEEHKADILFNSGKYGSKTTNTETIGYEIDLNSNKVQALFKMTRNNQDTYFVLEFKINDIHIDTDKSISLEIDSYALQNGIIFQNVETEFSPNAENVYLFFNKVILPDNARYSAYSISSQAAFGGGYWPQVTTNVMYTVRETIYFNSFDIVTDGYENFTKNSDGGARYEERGGFSFSFGTSNTIWQKDIPTD